MDRSQEASSKKCEIINQSENNEEESLDTFPNDLKIRKLVLNDWLNLTKVYVTPLK